jgi:predicted CopG family antitoxin
MKRILRIYWNWNWSFIRVVSKCIVLKKTLLKNDINKCMEINYAVKTITIDMEAYNILFSEKKQGESFSQVIERRLKKNSTAKNLLYNLELFTLSNEIYTDFCKKKIKRADYFV